MPIGRMGRRNADDCRLVLSDTLYRLLHRGCTPSASWSVVLKFLRANHVGELDGLSLTTSVSHLAILPSPWRRRRRLSLG